MKRLLLVPLLVLAPSCKAIGAAFSSSDDAATDRQAQAIGDAAGDAAGLITGNPIVDTAVTLFVGGAAGLLLRLKRKPKAKPKTEQPT